MKYKPLRRKQHELLLAELRMWRGDAKAFKDVLNEIRNLTGGSYVSMTRENWDAINLKVRAALNNRERL